MNTIIKSSVFIGLFLMLFVGGIQGWAVQAQSPIPTDGRASKTGGKVRIEHKSHHLILDNSQPIGI